jgi:hypothetical protein
MHRRGIVPGPGGPLNDRGSEGGPSVLKAVGVTAVLLPLVVAGATLAAQPQPGTRYSGSGKLCLNNTPDQSFTNCRSRDTFSLHTSANGRRVSRFRGRVGPLWCGGGTDTVRDARLAIRKDGSFDDAFTAPNRVGGQTNGTVHVKINGQFKGTGGKVHVVYSAVVHFSGTSHKEDCGGRVEGDGHAR